MPRLRNKLRIASSLLLLLLLLFSTTPHLASQAHQDFSGDLHLQTTSDNPANYKPGEVLVKLRPGVQIASPAELLDKVPGVDPASTTQVSSILDTGIQVWEVGEGSESIIVEQLQSDPRVEFAEFNFMYHALNTPDDKLLKDQWALERINAFDAWEITQGDEAIIIAVLDSGIDETHPDLSPKIVMGYDAIDQDNNPHDLHGHGTHVAGIAAAVTNNGTGIAGMSWGSRLMPVRVLDELGYGTGSEITEGIVWAIQHGAKILNLSLGGDDYSEAMQLAINQAHDQGVLVIAAMGNCRIAGPGCPVANPITYPAAMNNVLAVSATSRYDNYAWYSQYGEYVDLAAPGGEMQWYNDKEGIISTMPFYDVYLTTAYSYKNGYDFLGFQPENVQGTSYAVPHVAGLAALILTLQPDLSPDEVQSILQDTAVDLGLVGWDVNYGWGRIDALEAVLAAAPQLAAPVLHKVDNDDLDGQFTLRWDAAEGAEEYLLEQASVSDFSTATTLYQGPDLEFEILDQPAGLWYYRVRAISGLVKSNWSNTETAGVLPDAPVLAPIDNKDGADYYQVAWELVNGADGYILQESSDISFTLPITRYIGTAIDYQVTGQAGGEWFYRARAYNIVGAGSWSTDVVSTHVITPALEAPVLQAIENVDINGDYLLDWSEVVSATNYLVEIAANPYFVDPSEIYTGTQTTLEVDDQDPGEWYYRVRALDDSDGSSPWSASQKAIVFEWVYLPVIIKLENQ